MMFILYLFPGFYLIFVLILREQVLGAELMFLHQRATHNRLMLMLRANCDD